jgi:dTDP-4-dehydrorhamnose reductase
VAKIRIHELAKKLADTFGYDSEKVEPITAKEIGFKAPRPKDTSLDISKSKSNGITFSKIDNAIIKLKDSYEKK